MRYLIPLMFLSASFAGRADIPGFSADENYQLPDVDSQQYAKWIADYVQFAEQRDVGRFALDYPKTAKDLRAKQRDLRVRALKVCAASGDVRCIPLIVAQLHRPNSDVQVEAGSSLERLVTEYELRRRDPSFNDRVEILPLREGDVDLRPLRWVLVDMLCSGEPNLQAYAANMIAYLRLSEFEPTLRAVHQSRHPAAYRAVETAFDRLGLPYKEREK